MLPSAPFTLYVHVAVNGELGSSLSKHAFDMWEIVAPLSNKDTVWLLILTGKLAAIFGITEFDFDLFHVPKTII